MGPRPVGRGIARVGRGCVLGEAGFNGSAAGGPRYRTLPLQALRTLHRFNGSAARGPRYRATASPPWLTLARFNGSAARGPRYRAPLRWKCYLHVWLQWVRGPWA